MSGSPLCTWTCCQTPEKCWDIYWAYNLLSEEYAETFVLWIFFQIYTILAGQTLEPDCRALQSVGQGAQSKIKHCPSSVGSCLQAKFLLLRQMAHASRRPFCAWTCRWTISKVLDQIWLELSPNMQLCPSIFKEIFKETQGLYRHLNPVFMALRSQG